MLSILNTESQKHKKKRKKVISLQYTSKQQTTNNNNKQTTKTNNKQTTKTNNKNKQQTTNNKQTKKKRMGSQVDLSKTSSIKNRRGHKAPNIVITTNDPAPPISALSLISPDVPSEILPYLYLGSEQHVVSLRLLEELKITGN